MKILRHGKCANLTDVLYLYRQSQTSLTATKKAEMREGTDHVMKREQATNQLARFRMREARTAFKKAAEYKPASVVVNGKHMRTKLKWLYQSYLFGLSKLYATRGEYVSAAYVMAVSFFINPFRYMYAVVEVAYRRVFTT